MFKRDLAMSQGPTADDKAFSNEHPLTTLATGSGDYERMEGVHLTEDGPGFLFFSSVISPLEGDVVVWDAGSRSVQARRLGDEKLSLHWNVSAKNMDCLMVAADKGHVYLSDYNDGPLDANHFPNEVALKGNPKFRDLKKYFIVLNATNGDVLANVTIAESQKITAMMVIAGQNNDVFMGSTKGLTRIYLETDTVRSSPEEFVEVDVVVNGN